MSLVFGDWHLPICCLLIAAQLTVSSLFISFLRLRLDLQSYDEQSKVLSNADLQ